VGSILALAHSSKPNLIPIPAQGAGTVHLAPAPVQLVDIWSDLRAAARLEGDRPSLPIASRPVQFVLAGGVLAPEGPAGLFVVACVPPAGDWPCTLLPFPPCDPSL